jgi:hypothetical protein
MLLSRYNLVDNIDETSCCDRLFGQVVVTSYLYRFGAWLMHLFMVVQTPYLRRVYDLPASGSLYFLS